ncbi:MULTISPECIES: ABC transporter permease [unclassified Microbacterium]|uniref:ABC transporter permease n=1 Tax=unclassified Microbacterium TaxID=2609290 RepID=UPI00188FFD9F|nr:MULTISPECIES: ABC transporter permease [unclassified Microbacterium]
MSSEMIDPTLHTAEQPAPVAVQRKRMSTFALYYRRFMRNKPAVFGVIVFLALVLFSIVGPLVARYDHIYLDFLNLGTPPSGDHWFGTTPAGNDLFAQVSIGLQRSLMIAVTVSVGTTALSAVVGTAAAYFGGRIERFTLLLIHFLMVIPTFLILALVSNTAGGDWRVIALALIFIGWFFQARVIWTMALSLREREYVEAARYMGVRGMTIVMRHLLPNIGSLLVINFTLGVVAAVMTETGLSFIGFGVKIPDVSLGSLIGSGANSITSAPWLFYFPAAALVLLTVSMALVADGLRDALDPTSAAGGRA